MWLTQLGSRKCLYAAANAIRTVSLAGRWMNTTYFIDSRRTGEESLKTKREGRLNNIITFTSFTICIETQGSRTSQLTIRKIKACSSRRRMEDVYNLIQQRNSYETFPCLTATSITFNKTSNVNYLRCYSTKLASRTKEQSTKPEEAKTLRKYSEDDNKMVDHAAILLPCGRS